MTNDAFLTLLRTISDILTAGIAITAFSLLLFSVTLNLRDRVVRSFSLIMVSVVIVFSAEAFGSTAIEPWQVELWLRLQWIGIVLLPAMYFSFSDAVLATTGKPSRWRRKWASLAGYIISFVFLILIPTDLLVGPLVLEGQPAPHLQATLFTDLFTLYYLIVMVMTWVNFIRAYRRTLTSTSQRRMGYLLIGGMAPAIGSYPFLLFGSGLASMYPYFFWIVVSVSNIFVGGLMIIMAYAVSFFGMPWPDRVVKSRLLLWILRGPFTASVALALTTIVRRAGLIIGQTYTAWVPIVMVLTVVLLEYFITLLGPFLQRWFFYGNDQTDLDLIQTMEDRLLTRSDLQQFMEMILAAVCDHLQVKGAFLFAYQRDKLDIVAKVGKLKPPELDEESLKSTSQGSEVAINFVQNMEQLIIPIRDGIEEDLDFLFGYMVISGKVYKELDQDQISALNVLIDRARLALQDRLTQEQVFTAVESLTSKVGYIQQLRAAGRYDRNGILTANLDLVMENMDHWVKDALTHYWGGPRLTENPLIQLQIVQNYQDEHDENPANALRSVLKNAVETMKPEGDRRYTSEWILFNILEMKFMEGKRVKEIANKLAISEADLYRKQRVAINEVSKVLLEMESQNRVFRSVG